ncbi:MAG: GDSL-like Lipase/Acylhydrolase [Bacteroidetes bacterium ADurb.Bin037]|nr:MAG: GDSL-like Lipase/Acylhydrolase [Bacteroidetes bacterium ADurb.Bin037]HPW78613.1 GDSL-type esterase/lipase family protein [Bacteroidales bacterium]HQB56044.1 GDSL-type esterase/lipase family protein [Bacteroidales bacterium]
MKHLSVFILVVCSVVTAMAQKGDVQNIRPDAVFMGNSITQNWRHFHPGFFTENNYVNKGIGGEVTSQMLVRFRRDVIRLNPKVVVILAGTNDIAQNQGYVTHAQIMDNIASMADLAKCHHIRVVLCSVLPAGAYRWRPEEFNRMVAPGQAIERLNDMIREYAFENDCEYVDFWTPMSDGNKGMKQELSPDGVHPYADAYFMMEELITPVIRRLCTP